MKNRITTAAMYALLCLALVVTTALVAGPMRTNQAAPGAGVICVTSTPSGATFTISGAASYNGTTPWATADAPAGPYTITWDNLAGYTSPAGESQTLDAGSALLFEGGYAEGETTPQAGTVGVTSNLPGATFTLSGASSYNGTAPWAEAGAPPGDYSITWDNMAGFTAPESGNQTLETGGAIVFDGLFEPAPVETGTIGVASAPAGATFTLSGAASYNGTAPWAIADAPAGDYSMTWDNMTGFTGAPDSENQTLEVGGAIAFQGLYADNATLPETGAITVTSAPPGAGFTITGALSYSGATPWVMADVPAGSYAIAWENMTGFSAPSGDNQTLEAGEVLSFHGGYTAASSQGATIGVASNQPEAAFTLSGPDGYQGTAPWAKADALAGSYAITWDNLTGYVAPASENRTLEAGDGVTFLGIYEPAPPQMGTIGVTSDPDGGTFTLSGAASYNGTAPWAATDAPAGDYTITWDNMAGYTTTPPSENRTLPAAGSVVFRGLYAENVTAPEAGTIGVTSNAPGAAFTLSGAASYNGTAPWAVADAPAGAYTIVWDNITGYATPDSEDRDLAAGEAVTFRGDYTPVTAPPQVGVIGVTSNVSGAAFTISGAASYNGTAPWAVDNATPGAYTIKWGDMAGYVTPQAATMTLEAGGAISFEGQYISSRWTYEFHDRKRGTALYINTMDKTFRFTGPRGFDSGVQKATWMRVQKLRGGKIHVNMYYRGQSFRVILHAHAWQDFCEAWVYKVHKVTLYRLVDPRGFD